MRAMATAAIGPFAMRTSNPGTTTSTHHWRIVATAPAIGQDSVRSQAHVLVNDILADYALTPTTQPPTCTLRDPDAGLDDRPDLLLHDTLKAYEPDPLERPRRRWWQSAMERGFAERDSA